jgi:hypothetical protein
MIVVSPVSDYRRHTQCVLQIVKPANFQLNTLTCRSAVGRTRRIGLVIPSGITRLFSDPDLFIPEPIGFQEVMLQN